MLPNSLPEREHDELGRAAHLTAHFQLILKAIAEGRLVLFLGAGVNLCDREEGSAWAIDQNLLPSGRDLSTHLANLYPAARDPCSDLMRVSQYVDVMMGRADLYNDLRKLFKAEFPPTTVHRFLAALPSALGKLGLPQTTDKSRRQLIIVTTNYDDVLERTFDAATERYHVITYRAHGDDAGKFEHTVPGGHKRVVIKKPNRYTKLLDNESPVIVKIHGAVDRAVEGHDSFVITEDHYIDYLSRADIGNFLPLPLMEILKTSHILFLGYSLRDWNVRVILHRIWGAQSLGHNGWAVQQNPAQFDYLFWARKNVFILDADLRNYINELSGFLSQQAMTRQPIVRQPRDG